MQLVRNIATEWGPRNIRANCIAPGLVRTDFARALWEDPEREAARSRETPLLRIGEPDEIAGAAVFLAAPASSFMTGQTMVIDGGVTIGRPQRRDERRRAMAGPVLVPVLPNHRFDEAALEALSCRPSRRVSAARSRSASSRAASRTRPSISRRRTRNTCCARSRPGKLLPSAHAVDREFRVQRALAGSAVPVTPMLLLCEDAGDHRHRRSTSWTISRAACSPTARCPASNPTSAPRCTMR